MGGMSVGTFHVNSAGHYGVFNGTCAIVPKLKAPGFIKASTGGWLDAKHQFPDVSQMLNGSIKLTVRSSNPSYEGFKLDPEVSLEDWQEVSVPFNKFSSDWSDFTGR